MKLILITVLSFISCINAWAQISLGGLPYSMIDQSNQVGSRTDYSGKAFALKSIDNQKELLKAQQKMLTCKDCPAPYGVGVDVALDIKRDGIQKIVSGGTVWILSVKSQNAYGMQFYFNKYKLPAKASLYIYNDDHSVILGAFTHINNHVNEKFATQFISGKNITLEYFEADDNDVNGELQIYKVIHAFRDINKVGSISGRVEGTSLPCTIDMNCSLGDPYQSVKKAVCRISVYDPFSNNVSLGTGFLINSLGSFRKPYVLTAWHVVASSANEEYLTPDYSTLVFEFNYENANCDFPLTSIKYKSINGASAVTGSNILSANADYMLFDLQTNSIEDWIDVMYMGWDVRPNIPYVGSVSIGHPDGDKKKVSISNSAPIATYIYTINGLIYSQGTTPKTGWNISWSNGITSSLSSGSLLIDKSSQLCIGYLRGGNSNCDANGSNIVSGPDYFGQLSYAWNTFQTTIFTQPLKNYLDPGNTGTKLLASYVPGGGTTGSTPPPGSLNGDSCPEKWGGVGMIPTVSLGSFETDIVDQCVKSWKLTLGSALTQCFRNNGGYHRCVQLIGYHVSDLSEISRDYNFIAGKEYIMTIKVYSADKPVNMGKLEVLLRNTIGYTNRPVPQNCGVYGSTPAIKPDDQVVMTLDKSKFQINSGAKFNTYAIRFVPKTNFKYIAIRYGPGNTYDPNKTDTWATSVFVDEIYLYDPGDFKNPQCNNNLTFSASSQIPVNAMTNNSIVLAKNGTNSPVVFAGETKTMTSKSVVMREGFEARYGSSFQARIDDCLIRTAHDAPVGPIDDHSMVTSRKADTVYNASMIYNYEQVANIYRKDLGVENSVKIFGETMVIASPNPSSRKVTFRYVLAEASLVKLKITDLNGRVIAVLMENYQGKGFHELNYDTSALSSGTYLYTFENLKRRETNRLMVIKE